MLKKVVLLVVVMALAACSAAPVVESVALPATTKLCLVKNPDVSAETLVVIKNVLAQKQIEYRVVNTFNEKDCPWQMTYSGYAYKGSTQYTRVKIYHDGIVTASAEKDERASPAAFRASIEDSIMALATAIIQ